MATSLTTITHLAQGMACEPKDKCITRPKILPIPQMPINQSDAAWMPTTSLQEVEMLGK